MENNPEKDEHLQRVAIERAEVAKYLAANPTEALGSGAAIGALQNVYMTNIPKQFEWGKSLTREGAFALATAAAQTGLNPLFGQILMLGGSIYLTEKGCHHISNTRPEFDGYELTPIPKSEYEELGFKPDEIAWKCLVYRKDRSRPTPGYGRASAANVGLPAVKTHWLSEMAQKRAIQRAMTRAFALPFGEADGAGEDMADVIVKNVTPTQSLAATRMQDVLTRLNAASRSVSVREIVEQASEAEYAEPIEVEAPRSTTSKTSAPKEAQTQSEPREITAQDMETIRGTVAVLDTNAIMREANAMGLTFEDLGKVIERATGQKTLTIDKVHDVFAALEALMGDGL